MMGAASAQERPAADPGDIVVTAVTKPYQIDVHALIVARNAFEQGRPSFAPAATLFFEVREQGHAAARSDLRLTLVDGQRAVPVLLDQGRFTLPALPEGKWRLTANRARRAITVQALVMTPGTTEGDRRLGDLRLQCRALIAMAKTEASIALLPVIGLFEAMGPCTSRRIGIYYSTSSPIAGAELREGGRTEPVSVGPNGRGYRAPIQDRSFTNEARLTLTPKPI
ncbi:hypothetical protein [Sphingomonas bacterium]|uniref:hypothetical protein n=1 Tax=Sphingomonas bacterium TaxID=1895847 RepID=UPI00157716D6|nr:hypothetical protein [Sphingomonas bacterium]